MLSMQRGLNRRTLWRPGFRSYPLNEGDLLGQKVRYTHGNPFRRGLCTRPEDYPWSSARLWQDMRWSPDTGIMDAM